jgi:flagellar biosynthesis protein FlhB
MAEDDDDSQKTEDPTHKKLEDARKKGQLPASREVNSFFIMLAMALIVLAIIPHATPQFTRSMLPFFEAAHDFPMGEGAFIQMTKQLLGSLSLVMLPIFIIAMVAALAGGGLQSKFNFSAEPLKPSFERISPMKGLKKLFSMRSVIELIKGIIKITVVAMVGWHAISPNIEGLRVLPMKDIPDAMNFMMTLVTRMIIGILSILFLIAIGDYLYQRYEYIKNLRMTKQEIKEEYKQQEGDPHVKQKVRQLRMERARKRMMAAVPNSDVVITNPTHYAVALRYDEGTMNAPTIVAKGTDKVALKIRELAEQNKIPVMRNPPLARALFDNGEIDAEIPLDHYQAVAKIIGYVYKLRGKHVLRKPMDSKAGARNTNNDPTSGKSKKLRL